jgi:hypothetical protein
MKVNIIFLVSLILFSQSFAYMPQESTLKYILGELLELNALAGADKVNLSVLVSRVEDAIKSVQKGAHSVFDEVVNTCKKGHKLYDDAIKRIDDDALTDGVEITNSEKKVKSLSDRLASYRGELTKAHGELKTLKKNLAEERVLTKQTMSEIHEKRDTVRVLLDIINDELLEVNSKAPAGKTGFVQIEKVESAVNAIKEKLGNGDIMFSPLVSALVALTTGRKHSDQATLRKIIGLLNKIDSNLKAFGKKQVESHKKIQNLLQQQFSNKVSQVRNYQRLLADTAEEGNGLRKIVSGLREQVAVGKTHRSIKVSESSHWDKFCDHQRNIAKTFTDDKESKKAIADLKGNLASLA